MTRENFIRLIEKEQEGLMRFLLALCGGNRSDAQDLAQESALKAYLSYGGFVEKFRFSTWLYRIAYNTFVDFQRKKSLETDPLESAELQASEPAQNPAEFEDLYRAIETLPVNEKTAILLFYMQNMKILDIAIIMHKPIGTVKSYLSRGRSHLKTSLNNG